MEPDGQLFEQYKMERASIDDITRDRNAQSRFLFGIVTALLGFISFTVRTFDSNWMAQSNWGGWLVVAIAANFGWFASSSFHNIMSNYNVTIRAKYCVLREMESRPEIGFALYTRERAVRDEKGVQSTTGLVIDFGHGLVSAFGTVATLSYLMVLVAAANISS
jgi:hypothetical protein